MSDHTKLEASAHRHTHEVCIFRDNEYVHEIASDDFCFIMMVERSTLDQLNILESANAKLYAITQSVLLVEIREFIAGVVYDCPQCGLPSLNLLRTLSGAGHNTWRDLACDSIAHYPSLKGITYGQDAPTSAEPREIL